MDRNFFDATAEDTASKPVWKAPQVVETDIDAITAGPGNGPTIDGLTTGS